MYKIIWTAFFFTIKAKIIYTATILMIHIKSISIKDHRCIIILLYTLRLPKTDDKSILGLVTFVSCSHLSYFRGKVKEGER